MPPSPYSKAIFGLSNLPQSPEKIKGRICQAITSQSSYNHLTNNILYDIMHTCTLNAYPKDADDVRGVLEHRTGGNMYNKEVQKRYREKVADRIKEYQKEYYKNTIEERKRYKKEYYQRKKEELSRDGKLKRDSEEKINVGARIEKKKYEEIRKMLEEEGSNLTIFIKTAIEEYLQKHK